MTCQDRSLFTHLTLEIFTRHKVFTSRRYIPFVSGKGLSLPIKKQRKTCEKETKNLVSYLSYLAKYFDIMAGSRNNGARRNCPLLGRGWVNTYRGNGHALNNRRTVGSGVFCAVRAEVI
jgi:hypothetical protein